MRYAVVIERAARNFSAYIPDVPGCVSTGKTVQETLNNLREALEFHFQGMREDQLPIPDPQTFVDYVEVPIAANQKQAEAGKPEKIKSRLRRAI